MLTLTTARLRLRPLTEADFAAVHAYGCDAENTRFMPWGPNTEADTRAFLAEVVREAAEEPQRNYTFAAELLETGEVIGCCDLFRKGEAQGSLGWILRKDYWGRGLCTELCGALLAFGFNALELHRVYATCNAENAASWRVMEKNGMRREAHFRQARFGRVGTERRWSDEYWYALLAAEWREAHT